MVAFAFVGLRLVVKWKNFGRLIIDDFLIILAACCLLGDLIIQHYMWIQGMANIGGASSDQFIRIMKVGLADRDVQYSRESNTDHRTR